MKRSSGQPDGEASIPSPLSLDERAWSAALEQIPVCAHRIGRDGRFVDLNRAGLRLLAARDLEQARRIAYLDIVAGEDRERVRSMLKQAFAGKGEPFQFIGADGGVFEASLFPLARDGQVDQLFGVIQDLTSRHDAEAALTASEARYRKLVENSPYCIHEIDTDGRLMSMNRAGLCMMGAKDESEVVGTRYLDAVSPKDRPRIARLMRAAYTGKMSEFEFEAINGSIFASSFVPIVDDRDKVLRLMGLTQDVTQQTEDKRKLEATRHRLLLALQGTRLQLWERDLVHEKITRTCYENGQMMSEENPREAFADIHPDDREMLEERIQSHLAGETPRLESEHRWWVGGEYRWVFVQGSVVERDKRGVPLRMAGTLVDVTERHAGEEQRRKLEAQLQHAQRMESVGQLAGGIAHDFNNLLQVILGHLSLAQDVVDNTELSAYLAEVERASHRASQLTRQLLTLSRQSPTARRVQDLRSLLASFSRMIERVLPESIAFAMDAEEDVPPVLIDSAQFEQAILNLCVNARDAMPRGGALSIRLKRSEMPDRGPCAEIVVADSGEGMSEETAARAFDPFFTTKSKQSGSGLGLAMVYGIVRQHQGTVSLSSEPGRGTTVTLRFPASASAVAQAEESATRKPRTPARSGTILVVEDEDAVRRLFERALSSAGFDVLSAANGVAGLDLFAERRDEIDLVLADAVMPDMGGQEMCGRMLSLAPDTRILFTSGYHESTVLSSDFLRKHNLQVLAKPHTPTRLLEAIDGLLDRSGAAHPGSAGSEDRSRA